jgi:hypothetical protein
VPFCIFRDESIDRAERHLSIASGRSGSDRDLAIRLRPRPGSYCGCMAGQSREPPFSRRVLDGNYRYLFWPVWLLGAAIIVVSTASGPRWMSALGVVVLSSSYVTRGDRKSRSRLRAVRARSIDGSAVETAEENDRAAVRSNHGGEYPRKVAIVVLVQVYAIWGGLVLAAAGWDINVTMVVLIGLVVFAVGSTGLIPGRTGLVPLVVLNSDQRRFLAAHRQELRAARLARHGDHRA